MQKDIKVGLLTVTESPHDAHISTFHNASMKLLKTSGRLRAFAKKKMAEPLAHSFVNC